MRARGPAVALLLALPTAAAAQAQDLGHRVLGGVGADAAVQPDTGVMVGARTIAWRSDTLRDRDGEAVPIPGLALDAVAGVFGGAGTVRLGRGPWLTVTLAVPVVRTSLEAGDPRISLDRAGLGDLFFQPVRLGWRSTRGDAVVGYSVYAPTSPPPATPLAASQWVHELSFGGTVFFDRARGWRLSALGAWDVYGDKPDVDVRRGQTLQVQGGVAGPVHEVVELGLAAYALWQVTDDVGADLPPLLVGMRERTYGLGPELSVTIPQLRGRLTLRHTWDLGARSRPQGAALFLALTFGAWAPKAGPVVPDPPEGRQTGGSTTTYEGSPPA